MKTELPYHLSQSGDGPIYLVGANGTTVCKLHANPGSQYEKDNADFLLRATNSHDELVAALESMLVNSCACRGTGRWTKECTLCGDSTYDHICNDREVACERPACVGARTAIAKAGAP